MKSNSCQWAAHDSRCTCTMKCTPISFWFDSSKWKQPTTTRPTTATFPNAQQTKNTIVPIVLRTQQWYHTDLAPNGCDMQCSLYSDFKTIQFACVCLFPHQCNAMDLFVTIIYLHNQIIGCYSPCFVFLLAFFWYFFRSFLLLKKEAISQEQKYALHLHTNCCGIQLQLSLRILLSRWNFIFGLQSLTFYWKMNQFAFRIGISRVFENGFVTYFLFYSKIDGNFLGNFN